MRRLMVLCTVLVALLCVGCATRGEYVSWFHLNSGKLISVGMTETAIREILGTPKTIGFGPRGCPFALSNKFRFKIKSLDGVFEYAWYTKNGGTIVAWFTEDTIIGLGIIPAEGFRVVHGEESARLCLQSADI